jgi:hypothetical protein
MHTVQNSCPQFDIPVYKPIYISTFLCTVLYFCLHNSLSARQSAYLVTLHIYMFFSNRTTKLKKPYVAQADSHRTGRVHAQVMWDLWWTKWHWDRFISESFSFPCQYISTATPYSLILYRGRTQGR